MVKKLRLAIRVFIIFILFLAIMFNPKQNSFNHWFMERGRWNLSDKVMISEIEDSIPGDIFKKSTISRSNYIILSIFTIPSKAMKHYKYVGVMGYFIRVN
jgi:hypothetical protein